MKGATRQRGPFGYRLVVFLLGCVLTLLVAWLLGYVLRDFGRIPGPDFADFESRHVPEADVERLASLERDVADVVREIEREREVQSILRTSTESSRATMGQLVEIHRLKLERGVTPSEEEQSALAESQRLFLENQEKFQQANERVAALSDRRRGLDGEIRTLREAIAKSREPALEEYREAGRRHEYWIASLKLAFLLPIFLISSWLVLTKRWRAYRPLMWAVLAAAAWRVGAVIHEHFPAEVFRYVTICTGIAIVVLGLVKLIRFTLTPSRDWLLRQRREAYVSHRCPLCGEPIQRGALRFATWTRRGPVLHAPAAANDAGGDERPYVCPSCGTTLFAKCERCDAIRHTLLPFCESCGAENVEAPG